jgi:hypothetical protein
MPEFLFDLRRHGLPERIRDRARIERDQRGTRRAIVQNNGSCIEAVEDAEAVLRGARLQRE